MKLDNEHQNSCKTNKFCMNNAPSESICGGGGGGGSSSGSASGGGNSGLRCPADSLQSNGLNVYRSFTQVDEKFRELVF